MESKWNEERPNESTPGGDFTQAERSTLVIVDVQNDFCHADGSLGNRFRDRTAIDGMVETIELLRDKANEKQIPVVFIRSVHTPATDSMVWLSRSPNGTSICRAGTFGCEFYKLEPQPQDIVVDKHRYSGFVGTRLDHVLRRLQRDTLVFTGISTNVCVESTARDAFMRDYYVTLVGDATVAADSSAYSASLSNIERHFGRVLPSSEVIRMWDNVAQLANA